MSCIVWCDWCLTGSLWRWGDAKGRDGNYCRKLREREEDGAMTGVFEDTEGEFSSLNM